jgi:hypothetical protein
LHACQKCKAEKIEVSVTAFNGKDWAEVPALALKRGIAEGLTLREAFPQRA